MGQKVVLITGCGSGIGKALAESFFDCGCRVIATGRYIDKLGELAEAGITCLPLDVNDSSNIQNVIHEVLRLAGRIDVLINNAGYGLMGPMMDIDRAEITRQFRTNVFAPLEMMQCVAPVMRENGGGLMINIGSISGLVPTPFAGAYCASKAALHAISDAARMELEPFGIRVITVQPGAVRSGFGASAANKVMNIVTGNSWYFPLREAVVDRANVSQENTMPAREFARKLTKIALKKRPPAIVRMGRKSVWLPMLKWLLPAKILDRILQRRFSLSSFRGGR
jgi:short-subunit dehydrogenase